MRFWFLVFGKARQFAGACFVAVPRAEHTLKGVERVAQGFGFFPQGATVFGCPCPYGFTPPAAYLDRLLTEDEWLGLWQSCAHPAMS